jgi:hypothetical protein
MSVEAGKFCPACHRLNDVTASECEHCGVPFEWDINSSLLTTSRVASDTPFLTPEKLALLENVERDIPENGIAIYLTNHERPFDVRTDDDFIIGRKMGETLIKVVDLTPFNAYAMGISRQHVRIQRRENSYQVIDLGSTNGTWLNGERLPPDQPVPLPNPAQIQLAKMRLFTIYRLKNK